MIEGGVAGGSALSQAAQRRATAERLVLEAQWLEALATDERAVAGQLAQLPPAYALLHDLKLPGSKGNIDHLVIGPGGAFVVVTRRCQEAITFRGGQLWSGDLSLRDLLDAARVESQL
ncbi:MAG: nuclease-related domain-containing protein, partial [Actinomycetota bacterium]|nr:nuclease-related domain-containing protein [Actinomycetota bacterium]